MQASPRRLARFVLAALALASCTSPRSAAQGPDGGPVPTIGLSTDLGGGSGVAIDVDGIALADGADDVESIVMIGDSITVGSTAALEQAYAAAGFDDVRIEAQAGKRTSVHATGNRSGVEVAGDVIALDGDHAGELWVVALGTNDIGQYADADAVAAVIDEMLAVVPAEVPLVWVDTYWADRPDGAALVNQVIAARVAERGNAAVARWSRVAAADGVLVSDGVHPSTDGQALFADVTVSTVRAFLGR